MKQKILAFVVEHRGTIATGLRLLADAVDSLGGGAGAFTGPKRRYGFKK